MSGLVCPWCEEGPSKCECDKIDRKVTPHRRPVGGWVSKEVKQKFGSICGDLKKSEAFVIEKLVNEFVEKQDARTGRLDENI